jgi:hypothetical protein
VCGWLALTVGSPWTAERLPGLGTIVGSSLGHKVADDFGDGFLEVRGEVHERLPGALAPWVARHVWMSPTVLSIEMLVVS